MLYLCNIYVTTVSYICDTPSGFIYRRVYIILFFMAKIHISRLTFVIQGDRFVSEKNNLLWCIKYILNN